MPQKRMFSTQIVDSDAFLDMPISSQNLYFHLGMRADDEGFVGSPKKIMKILGSNEDDLKILIGKRFILSFESGVIVIKHWLIHNTIRMDRFNPTSYQKEKALIITKENKAYSEWQPIGNQLATSGCPKLSKVKLSEDNITTEQSSDSIPPEWDYQKKLEQYLKSEKDIDRLLAFFWSRKKFVFLNQKQLSREYARDVKIGRQILDSGYSAKQIEKAFDYVEENYKKIPWRLETVLKIIAEANK